MQRQRELIMHKPSEAVKQPQLFLKVRKPNHSRLATAQLYARQTPVFNYKNLPSGLPRTGDTSGSYQTAPCTLIHFPRNRLRRFRGKWDGGGLSSSRQILSPSGTSPEEDFYDKNIALPNDKAVRSPLSGRSGISTGAYFAARTSSAALGRK